MTSIELYKSDYLTTYYFPELSLIETVWTLSSVELSPEIFKHELENRIKVIEENKPKNVLINNKEFFYRLPPPLQTWLSQEYLQKYYELGIEKMAYIISDDLVAQVSIEQAIEEQENTDYQIRYFDDEETARQWLKSN